MIVKVCGMRQSLNVFEVASLKPDLMGFIFYPKSKRFVGNNFDPEIVNSVMPEIQSVGVFVNELQEIVTDAIRKYNFDFVQLHGNESPEYCAQIQNKCKVLKAFGIHEMFDWEILLPYMDVCEYFLLDTSTKGYGGSGEKFNWQTLNSYRITKPFLLSGGIGMNDAENILGLNHPQLVGVDINSCFELEPGLKDSNMIQHFIKKLKNPL